MKIESAFKYIFATILTLSASLVNAEIVTFNFTGFVPFKRDSNNNVPEYQVGTPVTGSFSYDADLSPYYVAYSSSTNIFTQSNNYIFTQSPAFELNIGENQYTSNEIKISLTKIKQTDSVGVTVLPSGKMRLNGEISEFSKMSLLILPLESGNPSANSEFGLPRNFADTFANGAYGHTSLSWSSYNESQNWSVDIRITNISSVPEPSSLATLSMGLASIGLLIISKKKINRKGNKSLTQYGNI